MANDQDTFDLLMLKKIEGQLSGDEQRALDTWLNASANHRAQYEQLLEVWQLTEQDAEPPEPDYQAGWARVASRIRRGSADRPAVRRARSLLSRPVWLVLPVVLLLLVLVWYLRPPSSDLQERLAERGETVSITLADETVVALNSGSRLAYPTTFSENERRVRLEGEAFFEVEARSVPFIVESNNAEVTVLGTRFNVSTWHDATHVMVQEGRVRLRAGSKPDVSVELAASEGAVLGLSNTLERLAPAQVADAFSWMEGIISFHQTPLWQVVEAMERAFDEDISLHPDKANTLVGGSIRTDSLNQALETICLLADCTISSEDGTIVLQ